MPVLTINGDKKKVACGPCIRGHRSSKCAHKDRVLIEVRKPGRPLGTCPHPAGSCSCERVVVNYMIPKDRSGSIIPPGLGTTVPAPSRVLKKSQRSVANFSQSTVQKVISGDPAALAALANFPTDKIAPPSSDTSSQPPSTASSTSSTPRIDALQGTPHSSVVEDHSHYSPRPGDRQEGWHDLYARSQTSKSMDVSGLPVPQLDTPPCCCSGSVDEAEGQEFQQQASDHSSVFQQASQPSQPFYQSPLGAYGLGNYPFPLPDFPSFELSIGCGGMQTPTETIQERLLAGTHNNCDCGDNCNCFACMTHPNNKATLEYVRYHNDLLSRPSSQDNFSNPQFSPEVRHDFNVQYQFGPSPNVRPQQTFQPQFASQFRGQIPMSYASMGWPNQPAPGVSVPQTPILELEQLHFHPNQPTASQVISPHGGYPVFQDQQQYPQGAQVLPVQKQPDHLAKQAHANASIKSPPLIPAPLDADSPLDDDTSTLSPSSFLFQQFTLPGCDDVTGTCQCGDGCECTGCLTHSGHQQDAQASCCSPTHDRKDSLDELALDSVKPHTS